MMIDEQDLRLEMIDNLLSSTRDRRERAMALHADMLAIDPIFYGHLAVWYQREGKVRDQRVLFLAHLLTSSDDAHRQAGFVLLQSLPPYLVARVLRVMREELGKVPRSARTAVKAYLRRQEQDPSRFDRSVLRARKVLKSLYASLRIRPGSRADRILFKADPPADSLPGKLRAISRESDPTRQARAVIKLGLPFTTALGVVRAQTPAVLVALLDAMSPQEVINHMAMLERRGALRHPRLRALVESKLEAARRDSRVSAYKATTAAAASRVDAEMVERLKGVTDAQLRRMGRIEQSTALLIDKSASMERALELGQQVAAMVSRLARRPPLVYAFDARPYLLQCAGSGDLEDWERAFAHLRAGGATGPGCVLEAMALRDQRVEQIVLITDEEENVKPRFVAALETYRKAQTISPRVVILRVGARERSISDQLARAGYEVESFDVPADQYSLPDMIALLTRPSRYHLLLEIVSTELPRRRSI